LRESILLTGVGTIGAWGSGAERLAAALAEGRSLASEVDRSAGYHRAGGSRRAALVPAGQLAPWLSPGEARRMSPPSKLAVAAARMALRCAGLPAQGEEGTAVVVATAFGPSTNTEALLKQILREGPESASPSLFTESVANAPAAQIAIACHATGPSLTVCQREAGPLIALGRAAGEVAAGRAHRALAGAVDEMTPLLHALLDRFGALAHGLGGEGGEDEEAARPFDLARNGFLAGEGATMIVVESAADLARRGGHALARLLAWGSAFDPTAPPTGWGTGAEPLARALGRILARAGLGVADVDLVVSGAAGSRDGDRLEAQVLRAAWATRGDCPLPPVVAPKAVTGEYGGGLLGAALLAAGGSSMGPTPGFATADPDLGITPYDGSSLPPPRTVLVTTLAAGGAAAWLLLGAPGEAVSR
jgi:3-oxoacyl-[acyl-carrier-protein] synthase II